MSFFFFFLVQWDLAQVSPSVIIHHLQPPNASTWPFLSASPSTLHHHSAAFGSRGFCSAFSRFGFPFELIARPRSIFMLLLLLFLSLLPGTPHLHLNRPPPLIPIGVWFISISLATLQMQKKKKKMFSSFPAITISFSSALSHFALCNQLLPACCACVVA